MFFWGSPRGVTKLNVLANTLRFWDFYCVVWGRGSPLGSKKLRFWTSSARKLGFGRPMIKAVYTACGLHSGAEKMTPKMHGIPTKGKQKAIICCGSPPGMRRTLVFRVL